MDGVGVFVVVVLYQTAAAEAVTLRTLGPALAMLGSGARVEGMVWDNTPGGQVAGEMPEGFRYRAAESNPGLAAAYNEAARMARAAGFGWMLTLDQDTALPKDFLVGMVRGLEEFGADARVGAVVPTVFDGSRQISPLRFVGGWLPRVVESGFCGVMERHGLAINSGAVLRLGTMEVVGGYDTRFPVNNSDSSYFFRMDAAGFRVAVAGWALVQHELGIMDRRGRMSVERYRRLLEDERAFWDLHMGVLGRVERMIRLVGRVAKDTVSGRNEEFRGATLAEVRYRLLTGRRTRLAAWLGSLE